MVVVLATTTTTTPVVLATLQHPNPSTAANLTTNLSISTVDLKKRRPAKSPRKSRHVDTNPRRRRSSHPARSGTCPAFNPSSPRPFQDPQPQTIRTPSSRTDHRPTTPTTTTTPSNPAPHQHRGLVAVTTTRLTTLP
uniref:(northern house mosquito) hypothetical protein n=1 Tax=Culex pipiens TaxID=7175 RepID=A0A8D8AS43_CULPI